ncbi:major facilitator superfamily domain-containing protein, putative [Eimeria acervulina]|uniref:Major facilitator superfamily domain-containing protein, putative n=1 Tax=Eimeria acervulina TaxID=5801 RepID=U6GF37_EIMAC|nr:major facilitator superfamily domain-containing protein, putative [Eimeria acervulina]CDI78137.1 major facilitator superfamily domain-containing protein, putative [Eimeria acervulina]
MEESKETCGGLKAWRLHVPLNRYLLLFLYLLVVLVRGCTYWGWNGIQEMLYKSGAYLWECDDPDAITELRIGNEKYVDCPARKQMLGGIFTTALGSNMLSSFLAGVILDAVGPKITMLFGIVMDIAGWLLLGFSGESFRAYYAAAFCIGVSADPGYLPLLSVSKLFPKNSSFVISIMGSVRSISFAIPVVMSAVFQSASFAPGDLWKMCVGYVGVGQGISLLVTLFFVPMASFKAPAITPAGGAGEEAAAGGELQQQDQEQREDSKEEGSVSTAAGASPQKDTRSFWQLLLDPKFLLLLPIFVCALVRSDFYAKSNKEQLLTSDGRDLYQLFAIFNILSFIPGPIFGRLVDKYGIILVLVLLNSAGVLMFLFLVFDRIACKGLSVFFFFVYTSFVLSNVYCFISINFPEHAFGKLTGLTSATGGVFVLISMLWYKKVLEFESPNNFIIVDGIMVAAGLLVYVLIFVLWRVSKKQREKPSKMEQQKTLPDPNEPSSTISV